MIAQLGDMVFYRAEDGRQHAAIVVREHANALVDLYALPRRSGNATTFRALVEEGPDNGQYSRTRDLFP